MKNIFKIDGMACGKCAAAVERATKNFDGVTSSTIDFSSKMLTLVYDESVLNSSTIIGMIEEIGYKAVLIDG